MKAKKKAAISYDCGARKGLVKRKEKGCPAVENHGYRAGLRKVKPKKKGAPKKATKKTYRRNPSPRDAVAQAVKLFEDFRGASPDNVERITLPPAPKALMVIGELLHVAYRTTRDGATEDFLHEFTKRARPLLCCSPDGKQLWIVGGDYRVTDRGITDRG